MSKTKRQQLNEDLANRPGGPMGKSNKAKRKLTQQELDKMAWNELFPNEPNPHEEEDPA